MEERGSFLVWGGGIAVLALVATAISWGIEKNAKQVKLRNELEQRIEENTFETAALYEAIDEAEMKWAPLSSLTDVGPSCDRLLNENASRSTVLAGLRDRKEKLSREVSLMDADFTAYRTAYRSGIWFEASGEEIGQLRTLDGREYESAVISRVTDQGLEIRHSNGVARIASDQLASSWNQRFQWKRPEALSEVK